MRLNETLAELTGGNFDEYGEWRYHITVMGTPSATEPWGWQLDGHHAIVNYFVLGDQVVMTPLFSGSEPVRRGIGQVQGHRRCCRTNRTAGWPSSTPSTSRGASRPSSRFAKSRDNNLTEAWKDNVVLDYAGIRATGLSDAQRTELLDLIALYVGNMDDGHARVKMEEVRAHLDRT